MMKPESAASALPFGKEVTHGKFTGHRKRLSRRIKGRYRLGGVLEKGRSWNAEYFHLEMGDYLYPEDRSRMEEIKQADPAAVVVNGYYSGYLGEDMSLDELTAGVRRHYENGYSNIGEFIEAHDDRLPPELIEEARAAAHAAGLPFSEKPTGTAKNPTPIYLTGA